MASRAVYRACQIGDVLVAQGNLSGAPEAYEASHDILDQFVKKIPATSTGDASSLSRRNKIGDVLVAQGSLPEALAAYWAPLDIRERLAKAEASGEGGPRQRWTAARPFRLAGEDR